MTILKAAKLEFFVDLLLGICVLLIAFKIDVTLLYAQASSSFIGAGIAFVNMWYIYKNHHEINEEKKLVNGRKEYVFNIALSVVLIYFGLAFFREGLHIEDEEQVNHTVLMIIAVISLIKFYIGNLTIKESQEIEATNLKIIGLITRNESFIGLVNVFTLSGLFSEVPFFSKISILVMAEVMILTGCKTISYYKNILIGVDMDEDETKEITDLLETISFIKKAKNLIVHDYGYYNKLATINAYVEKNITVEKLDASLKEVKSKIYEDHGIELIVNTILEEDVM